MKKPNGPKEPREPSPPTPPDETIDYQALVLEALRGVPRRALARVAEEGMPGGHHFYLSFRPTDPQVDVPGFLRDQYPEELTIILQHQFWSLEVDDEAFSVVLSFGGRRHRLFIPFASLTGFTDPFASFVLRFDTVPADESATAEAVSGEPRKEAAAATPEAEETSGGVLRFDPSRRK
jgi:hypothetical protein